MYWYSVAKGEFYKTDAEIMDETIRVAQTSNGA